MDYCLWPMTFVLQVKKECFEEYVVLKVQLKLSVVIFQAYYFCLLLDIMPRNCTCETILVSVSTSIYHPMIWSVVTHMPSCCLQKTPSQPYQCHRNGLVTSQCNRPDFTVCCVFFPVKQFTYWTDIFKDYIIL